MNQQSNRSRRPAGLWGRAAEGQQRGQGATTRPARAARLLRAIALGAAGVLAGSAAVMGVPTAALAADGDFTLQLEAPESVAVGQSFNYTATLDFEGPAATHSGIVLTTTIPTGVTFESCPIGGNSPIASCNYDSATRALTIALNDTQTDPLSLAYTVRSENYTDRYEGEILATSMTGSGGPSGPVTSNAVETVLTGSNQYSSTKSSRVIAGGDNRTVTYILNAFVAGPMPGTFASHAQELTDTFPAGVEYVGSSAPIGQWDVSNFPTAVWTNDGVYYAADSLDPSGSLSITVRYPESEFPGLVSPPSNTVDLRTQDANGVWHAGGSATTQSVPFVEGNVAGVAAGKEYFAGPSTAGFLAHSVVARGSYVGPSDSVDLDELVLEDSGAAGSANEAWFEHMDVLNLVVEFNGVLAAAGLPYTFEYQTNGSSSWQSVTPPSGTGSGVTFQTNVEGSVGWRAGTPVPVQAGETISGWRIVVAGGAESVPVNSEVRVVVAGQPVFRSISDGVIDQSEPAGAPVGPVDNTLVVRNGDGSMTADDSYTFTPVDSVYLTTRIGGFSSASVGGTAMYRASIVNQNPSEIYTDSVMTVVLPCGILYDESAPIVPETTPYLGVPSPAPAIGSGVTVDTTGRITDDDGCEMQAVTFTFDEVPPMRAPGTANHRGVENNGWTYDIPVTILAEAYSPSDTSVVARSWVHTNDPRFISVADGGAGANTVPMSGYGPFFGADVFDLDPTRSSIAVSDTRASINTAGGVLIDKLSAATADGPFALTSEVEADAFWRIFVSNVLPSPVTDAMFFDRLPSIADGDDFDVFLAGAVTGAPDGATVQYSTDATSATTGTWSSDPAGAVAFRVAVASMELGDNFTLIVPTSVDGDPLAMQAADNVVSATATYNGNPVSFESNDAEVTIAAAPDIDIVKTTNGIDVPSAEEAPVVPTGGAVQWSYVVTNTGNATLADVTVDDLGGPIEGAAEVVEVIAPDGFDGILEPGESVTFSASGTAIDGLYENVATTTGVPSDAEGEPLPETDAVDATDSSWYTGGTVGLSIAKEVSETEGGPWVESITASTGSTIYWRIAVTNTGETPLTNVVVSDPLATSFEEQTIEALAVGETRTFIVDHELVEGLTNVATASVDVEGDTLAVADDAAAALIPVTPQDPQDPQDPDAPEEPQDPTTGLAITGADATAILVIALLLVAGGTLFLLMRRRRADIAE